MNEKIKEIMEALSDNPEFIEKMNDINTRYPDIDENIHEFVKLVKEYGYDITEEEIDALCDVSESKLDQVAGGTINDDGTGNCFCVGLSGMGYEDEWQKDCYCHIGGAGYLTEKGKKKFPGLKCGLACTGTIGIAQ